MKKLRIFTDVKKEEVFLKEMAEQGWGLSNYSYWNIYTFKKIPAEKLNYRIDYQTFKKKADYLAYLTLFEDSGWRKISGSRWSGFQFFLPEEAKNQELDIFSDVASNNERSKRLYNQAIFWGALLIIYFFIFQPSFESISSWYLTPSIWAYSGLQLVGMILMETVFLLLQILPAAFFLVSAVYFLVSGMNVKKQLKKYEAG